MNTIMNDACMEIEVIKNNLSGETYFYNTLTNVFCFVFYSTFSEKYITYNMLVF